MATSKTAILQRAFIFLTTERSFQKRWVSLSSIESALRLRYPFRDHYNFDRAMLSKSLGKLHPKIDSLQDPNGLGVYQCKMPAGYFFTVQDLMLAPPEMLTTRANDSEWIKLCKVDEKLLASYEKRIQSSESRENNYDRHAKKKQKVLDDVDIFLANEKSKYNTTVCTNRDPPRMTEEWRKLDYWDSSRPSTKQRYLKDDLVALCGQRNISVTVEECELKEGWLGKPKGMLQVLWERGWIDPTKVVSSRSMRYSKEGKKEDFGEDGKLKDENRQFVLSHLLQQCKDFKEEMSDLEHLAKELGGRDATICIVFTPKYHCELAGEGIEYCWGAAKRLYRKLPLKKRRSWDSFRTSVLECLSQINVGMCRRFSAKARGYMLGYHHQALETEDGREEVKSFERNEKIHKIYRSHRDALSFDGEFISRVMRECITID